MISKIRGTLRLLLFVFGVLVYILRYFSKGLLVGVSVERGMRLRKEYLGLALWLLGVRIEVEGTPPTDGGLLVANHRSYLDPIIVLSQILAMPVAKKEVESWPIIGWGARLSGVFFVERGSKESRRNTRKAVAAAIRKGYFIINYPEGTTHDKSQTIPFKPGTFAEAAQGGFPVYPLAVDFLDRRDAWIDDDTFLPHFIRSFGKPHIYAKVRYGEAIFGEQAEDILLPAQSFIDRALREFRLDWEKEIYA